MSKITESEYKAACKVVELYEKQKRDEKLSIYDGCTKKDILTKVGVSLPYGHTEHYFWVTKDKEIPERTPDGTITYDSSCNFYTLERSHTPHDTFDKAYKCLLNTFKRKGFIK